MKAGGGSPLPPPAKSKSGSLLPRKREVLLQLRSYIFHTRAVLIEATVVVAVLPALEFALEIVVAGRAVLIAVGLAAMLDDFLYPPFLCFRGRINRLIALAPRVIDACCNMVALRL